MITIFQKIFGGLLLGIIILTSLILFFSFKTIRDHYIDTLTDELENTSYILSHDIAFRYNNDNSTIDSLVKVLGKKINLRLTVIDTNGVVIADSQKDPRLMENHGSRPEVLDANKSGKGRSLRYSTTVREEMLYVARTIVLDGKVVGFIRLSMYISQIDDLINNLSIKIFNVSIVVVIVSLLAVWFFSRSITRPIKQLAAASRKVAYGDFNAKVNLRNQDEIGDLANSFNYMIGEIKNLFDQVNKQKEELDTIISSIQEGFAVVNTNGDFLIFNEAFKKIIRKNIEKGKNYNKVISEKELIKLFKKIVKRKGSITKEIDLLEKYLLCSATYINSKDEIIFIFSDITEIKNLERIKRDIVANVSHELRTPLTAIKGFVDTLDDEVTDEKTKYYLAIIKRHTNRLIAIVQDLLVLSELEETNTKLQISGFNIKDMFETVLKMFEQKTSDKGLKLTYIIEEDLPEVFADMYKIEQALINLIDNAIKYTEQGEITLSAGMKDGKLILQVRDTGVGIPKEDQERIFERFYTVDKSRSRKLGGTGLGLSIVKHIVKIHAGDIDVKSVPKKGTKFTIQLLPDNRHLIA